MRYSFGLLALAGLAVSSPLVKRQDIDFDAYNEIPTASAVGAPIGVTAVQATTAAYNPSAAASAAANAAATIDDSSAATTSADTATPTDSLKKRDVGTSGCTVLAAAGNAPSTTPDTPAAFAANPVYSSAALNAPTPNGYIAVAVNKNGSAEDPSYMTYTTKGMTSYNPSVCAGYCTALAGCSSFNICKSPSFRKMFCDVFNIVCLVHSNSTLWITTRKCGWLWAAHDLHYILRSNS